MKTAWMLTAALICLAPAARAEEEASSPEAVAHESIPEPKLGPVAAMDAASARAFHVNELITAGAEPLTLVGRDKTRLELSPRSVATYDNQGFRLLRGSAVAESREETTVRTAGARVEYVGRALVSYDHSEESTSAFVLEGEARLVNAHRQDSTLRLARFHGATLEVGDVLPHLIRQLDVGAVDDWLKGYAWPTERREALLKGMPGEVAVKNEVPRHLEETKIEDYFSSIDTADEFHQPDYYEQKYDDPDKVVAQQNSANGAAKVLTPEEAALISLPKTQIDLGFDLAPQVLSADQKQKEVAQVKPRPAGQRGLASVEPAKKVKKKVKVVEQGDPDVSYVLSRLRQAHAPNGLNSRAPEARAPASVPAPVVDDPVYDYSQNF